MFTKRIEKIARELQRELSQIILHELNDPRIGFVSITKVKPASDGKSAQVFVSVLGDETASKKTLDGLNHARGYIQKIIADRMGLRFTPVLSFCHDKSIEEQLRISELVDENIKENDVE